MWVSSADFYQFLVVGSCWLMGLFCKAPANVISKIITKHPGAIYLLSHALYEFKEC